MLWPARRGRPPAQRPFYQQLLAKRGGDPSTLDWSDTVVDVTPGTYQVTYHGAKRGFDPDPVDDVIWAHIERMPDAPPHRKEHHEVS
ncbi:hypothetical protein [Nonomuraea ceibae]|uniref:hypothetical protein n=1 Tax=Nonomuraea ceibae TaxID=1935170 RepID=UPI001C5F62BB|nr:hypothetical protein [Nonomuraea ceibae]